MRNIILLIAVVFLFNACKKNNQVTLSSDKNISAVVFRSLDNPYLSADVIGVISQDTIKFQFSQGVPLSSLVPTISFSGRSINPANRTAQDFSNPVIYTITAENGSSKNYRFVVIQQTADTASLILGNWRVIKDSVWDSDYYYNGSGHPIPGVYHGTSADFWNFGSNGQLSAHENGLTVTGIAYQFLPNHELSVGGLDPYYGPATIETLNQNTAIFAWAASNPNGERYFRRLTLSR